VTWYSSETSLLRLIEPAERKSVAVKALGSFSAVVRAPRYSIFFKCCVSAFDGVGHSQWIVDGHHALTAEMATGIETIVASLVAWITRLHGRQIIHKSITIQVKMASSRTQRPASRRFCLDYDPGELHADIN
jgi:hypothetical protein